MSNPCDRAGNFRAQIKEYGLQEAESGSVGISLRCLLTEWWDGEKWIDWTPYDMEAEGTSWIVKKDGNTNDKAAEALMKYAGWDGSFVSITDGTWQPTPMACEIKPDEYKGVTRYRVEFINEFNRTPGASTLSNCDTSKAKALEAKYGAPLRALQANVNRNKPRSGPNTLPLPPAPPAPPKPAMAGAAAGNGDGIPFAWIVAALVSAGCQVNLFA